jgi:hypothetical protein
MLSFGPISSHPVSSLFPAKVVLPNISNRPACAWLQYPDKLEALLYLTEGWGVQYPDQALQIEHPEED